MKQFFTEAVFRDLGGYRNWRCGPRLNRALSFKVLNETTNKVPHTWVRIQTELSWKQRIMYRIRRVNFWLCSLETAAQSERVKYVAALVQTLVLLPDSLLGETEGA